MGSLCIDQGNPMDNYGFSWFGIVNIIAVAISPLIAVLIGQKLQARAEKRKDKIAVFQTLMKTRAYPWTSESMDAMNVIDIVFADDERVRTAWKKHYSNLCVSNPREQELMKIQTSKCKLLEAMARSLNYKNKINWEAIQNPYFPKGLENQILLNEQNQQMQMNLLRKMNEIVETTNKTDKER